MARGRGAGGAGRGERVPQTKLALARAGMGGARAGMGVARDAEERG